MKKQKIFPKKDKFLQFKANNYYVKNFFGGKANHQRGGTNWTQKGTT